MLIMVCHFKKICGIKQAKDWVNMTQSSPAHEHAREFPGMIRVAPYSDPTPKSLLAPQCLKLMVAQSPLETKNWAGPAKFDPGQIKIIINYIKREYFLNISGRLSENLKIETLAPEFWLVLNLVTADKIGTLVTADKIKVLYPHHPPTPKKSCRVMIFEISKTMPSGYDGHNELDNLLVNTFKSTAHLRGWGACRPALRETVKQFTLVWVLVRNPEDISVACSYRSKSLMKFSE